MKFELLYAEDADETLRELETSKDKASVFKAVRKTLGLMETNLRHPYLNTHPYSSLMGLNDEKLFESYAQNHTPVACRVFWHYGPKKNQITVVAIVPHP